MGRARLIVITIGALLLSVMPVLAHGYIVRAIPEDRSVLDRQPTRLQYWFSESLEPQFSSIILRDAEGNVLAEGGLDPENSTLMTLQIPPNTLKDGAYVVELRPAFSSDGHASTSTQVFFVGAETVNIASVASNTSAQPLEVLWKMLLLSGTFLLFGITMLYNFVLVPAWGNATYPAGLLPPRVMERLNALMWIGLALAIGGNLLALLQQSMVFFNVGAEQVITGGLWQIVRIGSRFGDIWTLRMVFLGVMTAVHVAGLFYRDAYPDMVEGFWSVGMWCMSLILAAQAVTSHAAGSLVMPWVAVSMHWLHIMASAFWIGGVASLALILPIALKPYTGDAKRQALLAVMRPFSRLVVGAVLIVITTGIYNSANWFFAPKDLQSTYGSTLLLKILMVVLLLAVGALHHIALRPALMARLEQTLATFPQFVTRSLARLVRVSSSFGISMNLETGIAIVVLVGASALSSTPVPLPDILQRKIPPQTQTVQVDDYTVTLTLAPGGTGVNTYDVVVQKGQQAVEDVQVDLQFSNPQRDIRGKIQPAESLGGGLYGASGADIDPVGVWWTTVDITGAEGVTTRAAFAWDINGSSNIIVSLDPSPINILSAFAVIGALCYVVYLSAKRLYARLNLAPQSILVALGVTAISIGLVVFSVWSIDGERQKQLNALNPLPSIVNPTLPDQASVTRGHDVYYEQCVIWQSVTDFQAFIKQVDRLRDEDIYQAVTQGWRKMPACKGDLTPAQTWDIVNFVRTLQRQFVTK